MRRFLENISHSADMRLAFSGGAWQFVLILVVGLLIKIFVLDSIKILGSQMEPSIKAHDRFLLFKTPYKLPIIRDIFIQYGDPVAAVFPNDNITTILRIAALSGDSINIEEGRYYLRQTPISIFEKDKKKYGLIAQTYSPLDFMAPYKIPAPGDSLIFGRLSLRDAVFAYSILRQEKSKVKMKAHIIKNGNRVGEYSIKDFSLYVGAIDSIPDEFYTDWFFWDRLQGYLDMTDESDSDDDKPRLAFSVFKGNKEITGFKVKKRYVFLMGENWTTAKDSRYFGPIASKNIKGRAFLAIWGFETKSNGKRRFDFKRICRYLK